MAQRPRIVIQPLGQVRPRLLAGLRRRLAEAYRIPVSVARSRLYLRGDGYSLPRDQYRADVLLDRLCDRVAEDGTCLLGVTEADVYVPHYNFLFGYSYVGGCCALLAVARLDEDGGAVTRLVLDRAAKIAIHELGHAFGLEHCRERGCVMRYADRVAAVDHENGRFCRDCRRDLRSLIES